MIFKKIQSLIQEFRNQNQALERQLKELEWAHIYHDSIRDNDDLQKLSLKVGRWAGNYSFFYLVHRILKDFKPHIVVEFGLGESTKFISTYNNSIGDLHEHIVIEQDENWKANFKESFRLNNFSIITNPLIKRKINGEEYHSYSNLEIIPSHGDFYIVDGPFGSPRYSRYDILEIANRFNADKEFIILMDDVNRKGEQETGKELMKLLNSIGIEFSFQYFIGNKTQLVIVSKQYKYVLTV